MSDVDAGTSTPQVVVHPSKELLAQAVAVRLVTALLDAQAARGSACVVLTGGSIGTAALAQVAASPLRATVDWGRVEVWWGDERFLPSGDPERNETQARAALLDHVPLDPARVHAMAASDGPDGPDLDAAAQRYAAALTTAAANDPTGLPRFDVMLLGVGPDGHVNSLFPGHPGVAERRSVIGVRDSPKPPPTRLSLTLPVVGKAEHVWLLVAGADKARVVRQALDGGAPEQIPAAGARGAQSTRWLLDRAAATRLGSG